MAPTSYWICSVVSYSQTAESSTPLRKVGYSAFARQGYIRQVHAQPSCFLISLDFYVSAPLFLATGAYLSLAFSRACHSARDWRGTLSKGCASRLSLWHLLGEYSFHILISNICQFIIVDLTKKNSFSTFVLFKSHLSGKKEKEIAKYSGFYLLYLMKKRVIN